MRLDASTADILAFLRSRDFAVRFPIQIAFSDDQAVVTLKSGNKATVVRREDGRLWLSIAFSQRHLVSNECLTYHDLLTIHTELEARQRVYEDTVNRIAGNPAMRDKAREYADAQNRLTGLLAKLGRILRDQRQAAQIVEDHELANPT